MTLTDMWVYMLESFIGHIMSDAFLVDG